MNENPQYVAKNETPDDLIRINKDIFNGDKDVFDRHKNSTKKFKRRFKESFEPRAEKIISKLSPEEAVRFINEFRKRNWRFNHGTKYMGY